MIRALLLACVGVVLVIVAVRGLMEHTRALPQVARGPARTYSSAVNIQSNVQPKSTAQALPAIRSTPPIRVPAAPPTGQTASVDSQLSGRFSVFAHQALASDPAGGTEKQYFARLGNLLNGTELPPGDKIPANADHLARAQADLDHDNLAGAVAEIGQLSGPAAGVMRPWLTDARTRLATARGARGPNRVAQSAPQTRGWPNVMPTEIPPYARESTGPAPSP